MTLSPITRHVRLILPWLCLAALALTPKQATAQAPVPPRWSEPVNLSESDTASLYPDLAVDSAGEVYVVWAEWNTDRDGQADKLMFSSAPGADAMNPQGWSSPNDIGLNPHLPQIEVDADGRLHLLSNPVLYSHAQAQGTPESAWAWSKPKDLAWRAGYWPRLVVSGQERIYAIFRDTMQYDLDRTINSDRRCTAGCTGIYLARSADGGASWSRTVRLDTLDTDAQEPYVAAGAEDRVYAVWTDTDTSEGSLTISFARSPDAGQTWEPAVHLAVGAEMDNPQIVVDGDEHLHVIWRRVGGIDYVNSSDGGRTWSKLESLEAPVTGAYSLGFAVDAADTLHLLAPLAGAGFDEGVYHFQRPTGASWSRPLRVANNACSEGADDIELVVSQGNRLHAVWYERLECRLGFAPPSGRGDVFYSRFVSDAPSTSAQPLPPLPTPTRAPDTMLGATRPPATALPSPTPTREPPPWSTEQAAPGSEAFGAAVGVAATAGALMALTAIVRRRPRGRK